MIAATARTHPLPARATHRSPWRMDSPPATGLLDRLPGAWPGALVVIALLGLLLAFASVVRDGVRRGEQLRSQTAVADWRCVALGPQASSLSCTRLGPSARLHNAESSQAFTQANATPLPARQE